MPAPRLYLQSIELVEQRIGPARSARQSLALGAADFSANAVGMETPEYVLPAKRADAADDGSSALRGRETGRPGGAERPQLHVLQLVAQVSGKA